MNEPLEPIVETKPEYGYLPIALKSTVFIKPVPKEHPGRLIVPPAYEPATDMGFVVCTGPEVDNSQMAPGALVMYDKFAVAGNEFELLDADGELVPMVRLDAAFVFAVLKRVKL
jgi:hypothetical protein